MLSEGLRKPIFGGSLGDIDDSLTAIRATELYYSLFDRKLNEESNDICKRFLAFLVLEISLEMGDIRIFGDFVLLHKNFFILLFYPGST